MDRNDYYFRQKVTEAELDDGFDKVETAINQTINDQGFVGTFSGGLVSEKSGTPNLSVDISGPMVAYDQSGRRVAFSALQNVDITLDENGVSTVVAGGGNEKTLTIFVEFDRTLSDARLDGNNNTVFFSRTESFVINVVQSPEASLGTSVPTGLRADQLLLADILLINGQTQVLNADIDESRKQIATRPSQFLSYGPGPAWHDATANPLTNVEGQLDKIINDLVANAGADRIGVAATPGGTVTAGGSIQDAMAELEAQGAFANYADFKHGLVYRKVAWGNADLGTWFFLGNGNYQLRNSQTSGVRDVYIELPNLKVGDFIDSARFEMILNTQAVNIDTAILRNDGTTETLVDSHTNVPPAGAKIHSNINHTVLQGHSYFFRFRVTGVASNEVIVAALELRYERV